MTDHRMSLLVILDQSWALFPENFDPRLYHTRLIPNCYSSIRPLALLFLVYMSVWQCYSFRRPPHPLGQETLSS